MEIFRQIVVAVTKTISLATDPALQRLVCVAIAPVGVVPGLVAEVPVMKQPGKKTERLSLTSFQFNKETQPSHAVSDSRYRLIRYADGFEELYDLQTDPNEFNNAADDTGLLSVKERLGVGMPMKVAPMVKIPIDSPYHRGRKPAKN